MTTIDLQRMPRTEWHRISYLLGPAIPDVLGLSAEWVQENYPARDALALCIEFLKQDLVDAVPADLDSLGRLWYYPWVQAEYELELSLAYALMSLHRAAYDHQRRGLELVAVGSYFISEHVTEEQAHAWRGAKEPTPYLTRAIDRLSRTGFPAELERKIGWVGRLKDQYWALSDIAHVRGTENALDVIQPSTVYLDGLPMPLLHPKALARTLDSYRVVAQNVALLLVATNPVLALPLPMDEKFGLHGPVSGFFQEYSVDRLSKVIGEPLWSAVSAAAEADPTASSLRESIESLPDLTEAEFKQQVEEERLTWDASSRPPADGQAEEGGG